MSRFQKFGRLAFVVVMLIMAAYSPIAAKARGGEYFEPDSSKCGDYVPVQPELDTWLRGDRDHIYLGFVITDQQIAGWECSGSHFDVNIDLADFSRTVDWSACTVYIDHDFTFGWDIVDNGRGSATVTISGAKLTENRMYPGYVYGIELDCPELRFSKRSEPIVSVEYRGAWYSTDPSQAGYTKTRFETTGTKGPAGLPVYVKYSDQNAWLQDRNGNTEFPFDN